MAWNSSPKVAAARDIAKKFGKTKVVVLMLDERKGTMEYASFGETKEMCAEARKLGDAVYDAAYRYLDSGV